MSNLLKLIVIVGPTASGKSALAVKLAKKFNGEIISADSRQVYQYLNIGAGKITRSEMEGIRHYCLNIAHPKRQITVVDYKQCAEKAIAAIIQRGKLPILAGGTGFYIQAVTQNIALPEVPPNPQLRGTLEKKTAHQLLAMLTRLDPQRASAIEQKNKRRLIRAIEIVKATGRPIPPLRHSGRGSFNILIIGIKQPGTELRKRIHKRLLERAQKGLIGEVRRLHERHGLSWRRLDNLGLEYRYISYYLRGRMERAEVFQKLETEIWRYAKRQMTWFKRDPRIHWINSDNDAERMMTLFLKHNQESK